MNSKSKHLAPPVQPQEATQTPSADGAYDFEIDLDSDSTHARVVRLVGNDRQVLELGPATGYMSRVFRDRGCSVVGIEVDPVMATQAAEYCQRIVVGDIDALDLDAELGSQRFDVVVAADVLEHLKDPLGALTRLREFLAPDGFFVISLPNVAHGSVRLALLEGHFRYQKLGLLDATHLRFFTRETIDELLDQAELGIAEIYRQQLDIEASEVPFDRGAVRAEVMRELEQDPDALTYQFVIKAIPFELHGLREMQRRMRELADEIGRLREDNRRLLELQEGLAAISGREGQLRAALLDAHEQLLRRDDQINHMREQLRPLQVIVDRLRARRIYSALRRARRMASAVSRRAARTRAVLRKP